MSESPLHAHPKPESHRLIDFESVEVHPGIVSGTFFLTVCGMKPCINMVVTLTPRIYVRCPEYWGIEVVGHLPDGICLDAIGRYDETISLTGITGSRGIEVIGATRTEKRDVPGGCTGFGGGAEARERFVVIALTGSEGDRYQGCRIVPEGEPYPAIYTQVFGPAPRAACAEWMEHHCGVASGDPA